jgi:hypothetical protein
MASTTVAAALGPVGLGIAGAAVLAYGAYSLGNLIYDNRKAIGKAFTTAGKWVGHQASNAYHAVSNTVDDAVHTITHPKNVLHSISHAFGL